MFENLNNFIKSYQYKINDILKRLDIYPDTNPDLYEDLFQAGLLGLIEAFHTYNSKIDTSITTHIQNHIIYSMIKTYRLNFEFSGYAINRLSLSDFYKLIYDEFEYITSPSKNIVNNLNTRVFPINTCNSIEDEALTNITIKEIIDLIPFLSETEQYVIINIYGLFGRRPKTYRTIAKELNTEFYKISYIHHKALKTLRELSKKSSSTFKAR